MSEKLNQNNSDSSETLPKQDRISSIRKRLSEVTMGLLGRASQDGHESTEVESGGVGMENTSMFTLDFHGDMLLIDKTLGKLNKPRKPHITLYDPEIKKYVTYCLSDIKIEHDGRNISYIRYLKKVGPPTVY